MNGSQLYDTNLAVANNTDLINANTTAITNNTNLINANTTAITNIQNLFGNGGDGPVRYSNTATPTVPNGGTPTNDVTLVGAAAGPVGLHNVAAGTLAAGSTDAVNGAQLHATNLAVEANTAAITNIQNNLGGGGGGGGGAEPGPVRYSDAATPTVPNGGRPTNDVTLVGALPGPVGLHNVAAGTLGEGSTDAVNGDQLHATNRALAETRALADANAAAIAGLGNSGGGGNAPGPVRYSNADSPETPNGGVPTNNLTLVGAEAAPVGLHNVADGRIAAGSTDAVNGGQMHALAEAGANAVRYDVDAAGARANRVTFSGGEASAPVTLANVAAGNVSAGSTEAVTGAQLHATEGRVAVSLAFAEEALATADEALALGANSVQYDPGRGSISLAGPTPVLVQNVAAGRAPADAVNVGQLNAALGDAVAQAQAYTDSRFAAIDLDLRSIRRDSNGGTAGALAAAALPQAFDPGSGMVSMGVGTFQGQSAFALGASKALDDGRTVLRVGATYDTRGRGGANAGVGFAFK